MGGTDLQQRDTAADGQPFFAPYRQNSLPDQVYEQIMAQIGGGSLAVGDRLPSEPSLSRALGVSRPVVRQALARLRADGVIASRQGAGSFVLRRPQADFLDCAPRGSIAELLRCFELRLALEGEAAALAAQRRGPGEMAAIDRAAAAMRSAVLSDHTAIVAAIRAGTPEAAAQAMRHHIERSRSSMLGLQG